MSRIQAVPQDLPSAIQALYDVIGLERLGLHHILTFFLRRIDPNSQSIGIDHLKSWLVEMLQTTNNTEDVSLTVAEMLCELFDTNGNGLVDSSELFKGMLVLSCNINYRVQLMFHTMDTNHSGTVSKAEVVAFFDSLWKVSCRLIGGFLADFELIFPGYASKDALSNLRNFGHQILRSPPENSNFLLSQKIESMFKYAHRPAFGITLLEMKKWGTLEEENVLLVSSLLGYIRVCDQNADARLESLADAVEYVQAHALLCDSIGGLHSLIKQFLVKMNSSSCELDKASFDDIIATSVGTGRANAMFCDVLFEFFDSDGNGSISASEFTTSLLGLTGPDPYRANAIFIAMDTDKSNTVTISEVEDFFVKFFQVGARLLGGLMVDFTRIFPSSSSAQHPSSLKSALESFGVQLLTKGFPSVEKFEISKRVESIFRYARNPTQGITGPEFSRWAKDNEEAMNGMSSFSTFLRFSTSFEEEMALNIVDPKNLCDAISRVYSLCGFSTVGLRDVIGKFLLQIDIRSQHMDADQFVTFMNSVVPTAVAESPHLTDVIFEFLDTNGTDSIDPAEIIYGSLALTGEDAYRCQALFFVLDRDHSGVVSLSEMFEFFHEFFISSSRLIGGLLADFTFLFPDAPVPVPCNFASFGRELLRHPLRVSDDYMRAILGSMFENVESPTKGITLIEFRKWAEQHPHQFLGISSFVHQLRYGGEVAEVDSVSTATKVRKEETHPLLVAVTQYNIDVIKEYAAVGSELNNKGLYGSTALHIAVQNGSVDIAEILINGGANSSITDDFGCTPLHYAVDGSTAMIALLVSKGHSDINARAGLQYTPLHFAVEDGYSDSVETLLFFGADTSLYTGKGEMAVHIAARLSRWNILLVFASAKNVNLNATMSDDIALTALHIAVLHGNTKCSKALLRSYADPRIRDGMGRTPLDIAISKSDTEMIKLLEEYTNTYQKRIINRDAMLKNGTSADENGIKEFYDAISKHQARRQNRTKGWNSDYAQRQSNNRLLEYNKLLQSTTPRQATVTSPDNNKKSDPPLSPTVARFLNRCEYYEQRRQENLENTRQSLKDREISAIRSKPYISPKSRLLAGSVAPIQDRYLNVLQVSQQKHDRLVSNALVSMQELAPHTPAISSNSRRLTVNRNSMEMIEKWEMQRTQRLSSSRSSIGKSKNEDSDTLNGVSHSKQACNMNNDSVSMAAMLERLSTRQTLSSDVMHATHRRDHCRHSVDTVARVKEMLKEETRSKSVPPFHHP